MTTRALRLITFRVGTETFAADIMAVEKIIRYEGSRPVPSAPAFVEGIIVIDGKVVPIVDLRRRLFPADASVREQLLVMITKSHAGPIGLKVDSVERIANITTDDLIAAPPLIRGVRGDYLVAVVEREGEVLLVLDLESVLTDEESAALSRV